MLLIADNLKWIVLSLLIAIGIGLFLCYVVKPKLSAYAAMKKHFSKFYLSASFSSFVSFVALFSFLTDWGLPGMDRLEFLCKDKAVYSVGNTQYVDGYYRDFPNCVHCWDYDIVENGFDYVEINADKQDKRFGITEPGIWKYTREAKSSGKCSADLAKQLIKKGGSFQRKEFIEHWCLSVEKLDRPMSEFGYFFSMDEIEILDNQHGSLISKTEQSVKRLSDDSVISKSVSFSLKPYPNDDLYSAYRVQCADVDKSTYRDPGANNVFYPTLRVRGKNRYSALTVQK